MVMEDRLPKKGFTGAQLRGMSTSQSGIPGQGYNTTQGGATSGFGGRPGGYQTASSAFSMGGTQQMGGKHSRLIERAKMVMHQEKLNQERIPINKGKGKGKKGNRR